VSEGGVGVNDGRIVAVDVSETGMLVFVDEEVGVQVIGGDVKDGVSVTMGAIVRETVTVKVAVEAGVAVADGVGDGGMGGNIKSQPSFRDNGHARISSF